MVMCLYIHIQLIYGIIAMLNWFTRFIVKTGCLYMYTVYDLYIFIDMFFTLSVILYPFSNGNRACIVLLSILCSITITLCILIYCKLWCVSFYISLKMTGISSRGHYRHVKPSLSLTPLLVITDVKNWNCYLIIVFGTAIKNWSIYRWVFAYSASHCPSAVLSCYSFVIPRSW